MTDPIIIVLDRVEAQTVRTGDSVSITPGPLGGGVTVQLFDRGTELQRVGVAASVTQVFGPYLRDIHFRVSAIGDDAVWQLIQASTDPNAPSSQTTVEAGTGGGGGGGSGGSDFFAAKTLNDIVEMGTDVTASLEVSNAVGAFWLRGQDLTPDQAGGTPENAASLMLLGPSANNPAVSASVSRSGIVFGTPFVAPDGTTAYDQGVFIAGATCVAANGNPYANGISILTGLAVSSVENGSVGNVFTDLTAGGVAGSYNLPIAFDITDGGEGYPDGVWLNWNIYVPSNKFLNNGYVGFESITVENGTIVELGPIISFAYGTATVGDVLTDGSILYPGFDSGSVTRLATITVTAVSLSVAGGSFLVLGSNASLEFDYNGIIKLNGNAGSTGQVLTSQGDSSPAVWADAGGGGGGGGGAVVAYVYVSDGDTVLASDHTDVTQFILMCNGNAPESVLSISFPESASTNQLFSVVSDFDITAVNWTVGGGNQGRDMPFGLKGGVAETWMYDGDTYWNRVAGQQYWIQDSSTPYVLTTPPQSNDRAAASMSFFESGTPSGLIVLPGYATTQGTGGYAVGAASFLIGGDAVAAIDDGTDSPEAQGGNVNLVAGAAFVSDGIGDVSAGNGVPGNVQLWPGRQTDAVPLAFTVMDGGSGYTFQGNIMDGTYYDKGQSQSVQAYNGDYNSRASFSVVTFSAGVLTAIGGVYGMYGTAPVGTTFPLSTIQGPAFAGISCDAQAALQVSEIATSTHGGQILLNAPMVDPITIGQYGELSMGDGSLGNPGFVLTSQGAGAPAIWAAPPPGTTYLVAVSEGGEDNILTSVYGVGLNLYSNFGNSDADLTNFTIGLPSSPADQETATFVFSINVAGLTISNGTVRNAATAAIAGVRQSYVYFDNYERWERTQ